MSDTTALEKFLARVRAFQKQPRYDWLGDNVASPTAPLQWFARIQTPAGPARWLFTGAKWLALVVWAVGFIWVWFLAFWLLLFCEALGPYGTKPSGAAPHSPGQHS